MGIISKCNEATNWCMPMFVLPKKDGTVRTVHDFRKLNEARKNLKKLDEFTQKLLCLPPGLPHPKVAAYLTDMEERFCGALANDLNMSRAMGGIFDFMKKINPILNMTGASCPVAKIPPKK